MTKESLTFEYLEKENILFANKKENREGKERKYLKKKSIFFAEETEKEGGKYLVKENMFFVEEKKNREGVEENVWRRKINFLRRSFWNTGFGNTGNQSQDGETKLPV